MLTPFLLFQTFSEGENTRSTRSAFPGASGKKTLGFGLFFSMKTVFFEVSFRVRAVLFDRNRVFFVDENSVFLQFRNPYLGLAEPYLPYF